MYRIFLLIILIAVGCIVAIPLKLIFDTWLGASWPAGWLSTYEAALLGMVPITFLIFTVFVHPTRRTLQGGEPWEKKKRGPPRYTGPIRPPGLERRNRRR